MRFQDREDAGRRLAKRLGAYRQESPLVLGLPRGGVPVAFEVARALEAPLDVWIVRKVGAPDFPELGLGAVAEGGVVYLNQALVDELGASRGELESLIRRKEAEVRERVRLFRGGAGSPQVAGRTVILVDDGIATGGTVQAAIQSLRAAGASRVVLAVPVAATDSLESLAEQFDDVVCLHSTPYLHAIGAWYEDFHQVPDEEVSELLRRARGRQAGPVPQGELTIRLEDAELSGTLAGPEQPRGLVLFAHGSGSSRFSPRNRHVASVLHRHGLATLLFDLLGREEGALDEQTAELRFDIGLLARRLVAVTDWTRRSARLSALPVGYFGSSTGAAAALVAAAERPQLVGAVVSRGGRPDLAWGRLAEVRAPTLLIVGGADEPVVELNRRAYARLTGPRRLVIVPGATHLFEEPGALDEVARLAGEWFAEQLRPRGAPEELHPT